MDCRRHIRVTGHEAALCPVLNAAESVAGNIFTPTVTMARESPSAVQSLGLTDITHLTLTGALHKAGCLNCVVNQSYSLNSRLGTRAKHHSFNHKTTMHYSLPTGLGRRWRYEARGMSPRTSILRHYDKKTKVLSTASWLRARLS